MLFRSQEKIDIHIHLPEGATPKDGPSAGITMASALISAITGRPVRNDIAMTGEITLRGRVLPIGGLKDKALAAHRAGIYQLIAPIDNQRDLIKVPEKIQKDMEFFWVESMDQVISLALLTNSDVAVTPQAEVEIAASEHEVKLPINDSREPIPAEVNWGE